MEARGKNINNMSEPFKMKYTNGKKADRTAFPFKVEAPQPGSSPTKAWDMGAAAGGAASGAAAGAVLGPWGAAAGAVVGGVVAGVKGGKAKEKAKKEEAERQKQMEIAQKEAEKQAKIAKYNPAPAYKDGEYQPTYGVTSDPNKT